MTALEVLRCGPGGTVQDAGRIGYRRFGVSTAGAMDLDALALANALVGNAPGAAALELPLLGGAFRLDGGAALVAAVGAGAPVAVGGRAVPPSTSALARPGEVIEIGAARTGVYTYLAVAGGIGTAPDLGSRSSHLRTGLGTPALSTGARLPVGGQARTGHPLILRGDAAPRPGPIAGVIRVVPGPQDTAFGPEAWEALLSAPFRVGARSDRMGLRLDGPRLAARQGHDIVSEGVVPGSIQVPGDGRPIVLGRDCQTTGGYPKIATVISADLGRLAQQRPGGALRFTAVSPEEARAAARTAATWRDTLGAALRPARTAPDDLLRHNLISGVSHGEDQ